MGWRGDHTTNRLKRKLATEPFREVANGFYMRRALVSVLAGPLPVENRVLRQTRLGVVMRHQLRLRLDGLGKLRLQHLRSPLVIALSRALQERLIGGFLDQSMLEDVPAPWRHTPLVDQLGVYQLRQPLLQRRLTHRRNGLE